MLHETIIKYVYHLQFSGQVKPFTHYLHTLKQLQRYQVVRSVQIVPDINLKGEQYDVPL